MLVAPITSPLALRPPRRDWQLALMVIGLRFGSHHGDHYSAAKGNAEGGMIICGTLE